MVCMIMFFASVLKSSAEWRWEVVYEYMCYESTDWVEYNDEVYLPMQHPESDRDELRNQIIPGETCIMKIYTGNPLNPYIDSCYAIYDYIPESYEIDGFWTYANNGSLIEPGGEYGICNINGATPIDWEEYPDYSEEEMNGIIVQSDMFFYMATSAVPSYIKIEILAYRYVDEE